MKQKPLTSNTYIPATLEELIADMELYPDKYKHLQFILHRQKNNLGLGQMFLVVKSSGRTVLQYFPPDSLKIDLPFILTQNKILTRRMPYMLLEKRVAGNHIAAIRLLDFHEKNTIVSLDVQEIAGSRTYTLTWNTEYSGDWWL